LRIFKAAFNIEDDKEAKRLIDNSTTDPLDASNMPHFAYMDYCINNMYDEEFSANRSTQADDTNVQRSDNEGQSGDEI